MGTQSQPRNVLLVSVVVIFASASGIANASSVSTTIPTATRTNATLLTTSVTNAKTSTPTGDVTSATTPTPTANVTNATTPTPTANVTNVTTPTPTANVTNATTPTQTANVTNATTPTPTANVTNATTPTPTANVTNATTPAPTVNVTNATTPTPTPTANVTNATTPTPTPTANATNATTPTPTANVTNATTPAPTVNVTNATTPTPTPTANVTNATTPTPTPTAKATNATTPTPTANVTNATTPAPTVNVTNATTPTPTPTANVTNATTPTPTANVTNATTPTPTANVTNATTPTPTANVTNATTPTPTANVINATTPTPTVDVTNATTPTANVTNATTPTPTANVTNATTPAPTVNVTNATTPTQTPTANVTNATTPTPTPTANATNATTPTPTANVTNATTPAPTVNVTNATTPTQTANVTNTTTPTPTASVTNATTPTPTVNVTNATTPTPTVNVTNATTPTQTANVTNATTPTQTANVTNATTPTPTPTANVTNATTPTPTVDVTNATTPTQTANVTNATTPTVNVTNTPTPTSITTPSPFYGYRVMFRLVAIEESSKSELSEKTLNILQLLVTKCSEEKTKKGSSYFLKFESYMADKICQLYESSNETCFFIVTSLKCGSLIVESEVVLGVNSTEKIEKKIKKGQLGVFVTNISSFASTYDKKILPPSEKSDEPSSEKSDEPSSEKSDEPSSERSDQPSGMSDTDRIWLTVGIILGVLLILLLLYLCCCRRNKEESDNERDPRYFAMDEMDNGKPNKNMPSVNEGFDDQDEAHSPGISTFKDGPENGNEPITKSYMDDVSALPDNDSNLAPLGEGEETDDELGMTVADVAIESDSEEQKKGPRPPETVPIIPPDSAHMAIEDLPKFLKECENENQKNKEYEDLDKTMTEPRTYPSNTLDQNRSVAIVPKHSTRVKLPGANDYINANFVKDHRGNNSFIATQHPLSNTMRDFWAMVWDQNVSVIVMVNDQEKDLENYHNYWLDHKNSLTIYGHMQVKTDNVETKPGFNLTRFILQNSQQNDIAKTVSHFRFTNWTEKGYPNPEDFAEFVRRFEKARLENRSQPVVVHCSDGQGYTGVAIATDIGLRVYNESDKKSAINVFDCVEKMRKDRNGIVCSKKMYNFIFEVLSALAGNKDTIDSKL